MGCYGFIALCFLVGLTVTNGAFDSSTGAKQNEIISLVKELKSELEQVRNNFNLQVHEVQIRVDGNEKQLNRLEQSLVPEDKIRKNIVLQIINDFKNGPKIQEAKFKWDQMLEMSPKSDFSQELDGIFGNQSLTQTWRNAEMMQFLNHALPRVNKVSAAQFMLNELDINLRNAKSTKNTLDPMEKIYYLKIVSDLEVEGSLSTHYRDILRNTKQSEPYYLLNSTLVIRSNSTGKYLVNFKEPMWVNVKTVANRSEATTWRLGPQDEDHFTIWHGTEEDKLPGLGNVPVNLRLRVTSRLTPPDQVKWAFIRDNSTRILLVGQPLDTKEVCEDGNCIWVLEKF